MDTTLSHFLAQSQNIHDRFSQELKSLRSGGATSQILDSVMVEAYGAQMKIAELASVQVVDATLLHVSPWDKSLLQDIEKAIASAGLNLNPVVDGDSIRIAIPPLTEEKRKESVKKLHSMAESSRVQLRTARNEAKKAIEKSEDADGISEDDVKRELADLEKHMKEQLDVIADVAQRKEAELLKL